MNPDLLNHALVRFTSPGWVIHITDASARILASTDEKRMGTASSTAQYIVKVQRPASIESASDDAAVGESSAVRYGAPVFVDEELAGAVIVSGPGNVVALHGNAIRLFLETALGYERARKNDGEESDDVVQLASLLLSSQVDTERVTSLMYKQEMDPSLLRSVICIQLEYHQTRYFNINLSLGYQSSIERIRQEAVQKLRSSRYLNSQDIVYIFNRSTLVVIKSFIPVEDLSRIYLSLDTICRDFGANLEPFSAFSFHMAYGNLYSGISDLRKSLDQALETIDIGRGVRPEERVHVLENILFEKICRSLDSQVVNKLLQPDIKKLLRKDGSVPLKLVDCCEAYVDSCMNFSATAERTGLHRNTISARLEKLRQITGLDPTTSLHDAFLVKMIAVYLRQARRVFSD